MNSRAFAAPDDEGMIFSAAAHELRAILHRLIGQRLGVGVGSGQS